MASMYACLKSIHHSVHAVGCRYMLCPCAGRCPQLSRQNSCLQNLEELKLVGAILEGSCVRMIAACAMADQAIRSACCTQVVCVCMWHMHKLWQIRSACCIVCVCMWRVCQENSSMCRLSHCWWYFYQWSTHACIVYVCMCHSVCMSVHRSAHMCVCVYVWMQHLRGIRSACCVVCGYVPER